MSTYYDLPLLKPPVWTWEVPTYFFVGGAAGAAAALGAIAQVTGADQTLVRDARWIAAAGATLSAPLLVADLGRPERFLNMLRVFKLQSPMSVGAWTLTAFGSASSAAAFAELVQRRTNLPVRVVGDASAVVAAATGLVMATYTGVLLGATAIPVWNENVRLLPVHFGASALGSAVSLLELRGHRDRALNALGLGTAIFETLVAASLDAGDDRVNAPLTRGRSGTLVRLAGALSGPVPLALRLFGARKAAAIATLAGSLATRFAWVEAGKASARDPRVAL
ncbi:MAG: polysulfide reductase NrfD [Acidobacteria bacterium]|nr:polysulfide reductase NrfD [Acidobacteriota bacterium]MBV9476719.1 polysulfide reductase NrfD [Acidobacteriota bacterium]